MCTSTLWRLPISIEDVPKHLRSAGYKNGAFIRLHNNRANLVEVAVSCAHYCSFDPNTFINRIEQVPCGQCEECLINRSRDWATRIVLEASEYEHNWFLTLTYDDVHLIDNIEFSVSRLDGSLSYVPFLKKDDFTAFKKRLLSRMRDKYGYTGIRFFECGEYGSKNGRPHYHAIFFNLPLPDLELYKKVSTGGKEYCYYRSKMVEECWGKGFVMIADVCYESAAYVARYVIKKFRGNDLNDYLRACSSSNVPVQPAEYINMSRKPGIARKYYDSEKNEFYKNDNIVLPNGRNVKPCRYFDKLYDVEYPEELADIKAERKRLAQLREMNKFYGKSPEEVSDIKKQEQEARSRARKKLVRNL